MSNNVVDISDMTNEIGNRILDFNVSQAIEEESYEKTIEIPTRYMNKARVTVSIPYLLSKTAKEAVKVALRRFNVNISEPHFIICELPNDEYIFLDPDKNLQSYNINDDCFFSILPQTHSVRFESIFCNKETMEMDLSMTVGDVVKKYLQQYNIEITHDYTISYEDNEEYVILMRDEIFGSCFIPSRTFRVFRRYFNFTREDLTSEFLAKQAYESILKAIPYMNLYPNDEQIQNLAYFTYLIDYNNTSLSNMPSDVVDFLPQAKSIEKYRKMIIKNYSKLKIPTKINCYRNWIRVMRSIPGFGAYIESAYITQDPSGKKRTQQCTAIANPIEIIFATQKCLKVRADSDNFCFRISFMNLKSVKLDYREVILTYYNRNKDENTIIAKLADEDIADEFYSYISENHSIIRKIFQNRAERKANGEKIEFSSSFEKINLKTISKISSKHCEIFSYDRDFTGRQLAEKAALNLQLIREGEKNHPEYVVLVIKSINEFEWLDLDKKLYEQEIFDNLIILVVNPITLIKFHNANSSKTLKIDLHMKIEDIIKRFMAKLGLPVLDGYALYYQDGDKKIPLNPENYIPGQCDNYKELWFQRRLYMITNEVANSRIIRYQSVNDCMSFFMNNETTMTLKQAIDLALMYRHATTTDIDEVKKDDGSTINAYVPKWVVVHENSVHFTSDKSDKFTWQK
ncbi:hypothetical protein TVAG_055360 [Trichomonas vaginalis G3]|uniref:FERM domain-containing protein n=1 Tax=Trichomonas vaginalis (strain ATCC PRA-98 / G3) TaxID=412133 RepID=A2ETK4_TRIV3|nr:Second domain of FERM family [Trichomonas vaginalis G3]EAY04050.1 hypothetical protein TVAG_055360 [Trichomonas vaginalis G3]KAI5538987.1 Second domain of FERM family [Trichomonas vaginalis G3]|eukprot:XP_001316273.1 hypothetical protein [Trichomonas vaginalis G3]